MKEVKVRKALMVVGMVSGLLIGMACSTAWISEAEKIVGALIPATENLVTLAAALEGKNMPAADLQTIQSTSSQAVAGLQLMQSLMVQYQTASAAAQPGLLSQIEIAMSAVQSNLHGLLPALHIKDEASQAKITAVVGILLSEVESVAAIVPLVNSGSPPRMLATATRLKKEAPLSASEFVNSYNVMMTAKTGNAELDKASARLRIHAHGKLARVASAGFVK